MPDDAALYSEPSNPVAASRTRPDRSTAMNTPPKTSTTKERAGSSGSARERARIAAQRHHASYGRLPTVTELMQLADVARGTAGSALKTLRAERPALHVVNADPESRNDQ
jgi:hypothetical protein